MSISELALVIQQIEGRTPTPSDPNYWGYRYRMESDRARRYPNKPNPELDKAKAAYWRKLFNLDPSE